MSTHVLKVNDDNAHLRVDVFLAQNLLEASSRSFVKRLLDAGHVTIAEKIVKPNRKVVSGEEVLVEIPPDFFTPQYISPENIPLNIFYEDDQIIIVNKPRGMLVHPATGCYTGTLVNALLNHSLQLSDFNSSMRAGIVHRLDQETSGLMVVAKDNITHTKLAKQFERHQVKKRYVALVEGDVVFDEGLINAPIGRHPKHREKKAVAFDDESARASQTFYKVLKRKKDVTLVALYPKTGRTHQLRVHMSYQRHPILGDDKYGRKSSFPRLALHAQSIGFTHPATKCYVEFSSMIPQEFLDRVKG